MVRRLVVAWWAYADPSRLAEVVERLETAFETGTVSTSDDADADAYRRRFAATREERETAHDVMVLTTMAGQRDDLEAPRPVDHVLVFDSVEEATAAVPRLEAAGFAVTIADEASAAVAENGTGTVIEATRTQQPSLLGLRAARAELDELCPGADYDGWGCVVVPRAARARRWFRRR